MASFAFPDKIEKTLTDILFTSTEIIQKHSKLFLFFTKNIRKTSISSLITNGGNVLKKKLNVKTLTWPYTKIY